MSEGLAAVLDVLVPVVEAIGVLVVLAGVGRVTVPALASALGLGAASADGARLSLARSLVLGLEFQVAADVMASAITPSFAEIGKLAAVAVIRTFLNVFLTRELRRADAAAAPAVRGS